jgi:hypothetical protein
MKYVKMIYIVLGTLNCVKFLVNLIFFYFFLLKRAIFKYILLTQLELLRRNETGFLLMQNYDAAIESTNTIFARLCR